MPMDFNQPRTGPQSKQAKQPNLAAKTPALEQLASQLATRGEAMEADARTIVQQSMGLVRDRVRMAVSEELEAVAGDADFFGFAGMFDSPEVTDTLPAIEVAVSPS